MNYIKQLQEQIAENTRLINEAAENINQLRRYLNSPKFHCGDELDGYVNTQDVLSRLDNVDLIER
jgi:hypothetical protein